MGVLDITLGCYGRQEKFCGGKFTEKVFKLQRKVCKKGRFRRFL